MRERDERDGPCLLERKERRKKRERETRKKDEADDVAIENRIPDLSRVQRLRRNSVQVAHLAPYSRDIEVSAGMDSW